MRDQRQHQALLQRRVAGREGKRLLVIGDGAVEVVVALGDPGGEIGSREGCDLDRLGGFLGMRRQTEIAMPATIASPVSQRARPCRIVSLSARRNPQVGGTAIDSHFSG
ncbi:hypothetical protein AJ88_09700 [Mesorhizobium amorphae CCBAU 01583]|nr:hypothetical protein AJ88_09700 [Mesorhizobium amorphae CCBAU 01583]